MYLFCVVPFTTPKTNIYFALFTCHSVFPWKKENCVLLLLLLVFHVQNWQKLFPFSPSGMITIWDKVASSQEASIPSMERECQVNQGALGINVIIVVVLFGDCCGLRTGEDLFWGQLQIFSRYVIPIWSKYCDVTLVLKLSLPDNVSASSFMNLWKCFQPPKSEYLPPFFMPLKKLHIKNQPPLIWYNIAIHFNIVVIGEVPSKNHEIYHLLQLISPDLFWTLITSDLQYAVWDNVKWLLIIAWSNDQIIWMTVTLSTTVLAVHVCTLPLHILVKKQWLIPVPTLPVGAMDKDLLSQRICTKCKI